MRTGRQDAALKATPSPYENAFRELVKDLRENEKRGRVLTAAIAALKPLIDPNSFADMLTQSWEVPPASDERDVHTEHCCTKHGCKYGDAEQCSVVAGQKKQSYPCEQCQEPAIGSKVQLVEAMHKVPWMEKPSPEPSGDDLCVTCGAFYREHIGDQGHVYPCWKVR